MPSEATQQDQFQRIDAYRRQQAEGQERFLKEVGGLIEEVKQLRLEADSVAMRLASKATTLREFVRRTTDESVPTLLVFVNAHLRLAGALQQGIRRTASIDRVLKKADQDREESRQRDEREANTLIARQQAKALTTAMAVTKSEAFDEIYGDIIDEEGLIDA